MKLSNLGLPTLNVAMMTEQLVVAKRAVPFQPFTIHLIEGPPVKVTHPEFVLLTHRGKTVVVNTPDDRLRIIDTSLIDQLTYSRKPPRRKK